MSISGQFLTWAQVFCSTIAAFSAGWMVWQYSAVIREGRRLIRAEQQSHQVLSDMFPDLKLPPVQPWKVVFDDAYVHVNRHLKISTIVIVAMSQARARRIAWELFIVFMLLSAGHGIFRLTA